MNVTNFLSLGAYIYLPTKKNPKVALFVESPSLAQNAFKLYNPFSAKARLLKSVSKVSFTNFNTISQSIFCSQNTKKSKFIRYLEIELGKPLISSLYFATAKDKVVIQLQTHNSEIIGYLKFPLNNSGIQHLTNEKKGIEILSKLNVCQKYIFYDKYEGKPFLLLPPIDGEFSLVKHHYLNSILEKFKQGKSYPLSRHPRIIKLIDDINDINDINNSKLLTLIEEATSNSCHQYDLVYEHGDFTPWNIVKMGEDYIPFDFEFFVEEGLEYFDLIKYYFQVGNLLDRKPPKELITFIFKKIKHPEINLLLQIFLVKEMIQKINENENYEIETIMINFLGKNENLS